MATQTEDKETISRVYKKSSPNGKLTTYLGRRDYYDHGSWVDNIDGIIVVDPEYLKNRKVFGIIVVAFRYGREDLDVMGMSFRKDFAVKQMQLYPPLEENKHLLTKLQARLLAKIGSNAVPFHFDLPTTTPDTVCIQPCEGDDGAPCGVDYQVTTYVGQSLDEKIHKRNSVSMSIRKLTYLEERKEPQPHGEISKEFKFTSGAMKLECSLDKAKYYSGETININVCVDNPTSKKAKKIRLQVLQYADICLYETVQYKNIVAEVETEEGFPIESNTSGFCKVYKIRPILDAAKRRAGLALNGRVKYEDTALAASTEMAGKVNKENLGIIVNYKIKIKMTLGFGSGDMVLEVPFKLAPNRLKGNFLKPEERASEDDKEDYDLVMEEFQRVAVKGFENEVSGGLTSMGE
ncbi:beta-arrestin-1 isoform X1 [Octopus bimaculoides]|uniref:beta-arrestin-1 isoform X1 n=1 Tax=Octopus bimaculoides TaxID=37653 RepID=UPI0022DEC5BE|nr:beta-arrestin-1 isoform X1 [Octopus bimaculoides]